MLTLGRKIKKENLDNLKKLLRKLDHLIDKNQEDLL